MVDSWISSRNRPKHFWPGTIRHSTQDAIPGHLVKVIERVEAQEGYRVVLVITIVDRQEACVATLAVQQETLRRLRSRLLLVASLIHQIH